MELDLAVCICTRDRPGSLQSTLQSVVASDPPPAQVIVSDDGTRPETEQLVRSYEPATTYVRGPQRGLSANRNRALRELRSEFVMFLDDDCLLHPGFIAQAGTCLSRSERRPFTIVTGRELNHGSLIEAADQSFLGFQDRPYRPGQPRRTIVINSTVFPAQLFRDVQFDEHLRYGYEEVDIAVQAVAHGYEIRFCPNAVNDHRPSALARNDYDRYVNSSRLYVTFKRYAYVERHPTKALLFAALAVPHHIAHSVKTAGIRGLRDALEDIARAIHYYRSPRATASARTS